MGYDCYIEYKAKKGPPFPKNWDDPVQRADYREWADLNYFRRNIWGMREMRKDLFDLGMAYDVRDYGLDEPPYPDHEDYGVTYRFNEKTCEDEYIGERAVEYEMAIDDWLSWHGVSDIPGIPLHKFGSNDGWHVTQIECVAALGIYRDQMENGKEHPESFGDDFISFLERAVAEDGFSVH